MDVYDFDGTLYRGDSTFDFFRWCASRHPRVLQSLPRTGIAAAACFGMHAIDKTRFKVALYRFLPLVPDIEGEVARFWDTHEHLICGPCTPAAGDVVATGSPEFLLRDVCSARGLKLLASKVDPHTGRVLGPNCSEGEKVARFRAAYPGASIERFFSDSHKDDPLAAIAHEAFLVRNGKITPWNH